MPVENVQFSGTMQNTFTEKTQSKFEGTGKIITPLRKPIIISIAVSFTITIAFTRTFTFALTYALKGKINARKRIHQLPGITRHHLRQIING